MGYITSEQQLTKNVLHYLEGLRENGAPLYYEHRSGQVSAGYKKGTPDLFIVYDGRHFEVELKGLYGKRSTAQDKWKWKCETIWNIPYCCPHTFEEFKSWFEGLIKKW